MFMASDEDIRERRTTSVVLVVEYMVWVWLLGVFKERVGFSGIANRL